MLTSVPHAAESLPIAVFPLLSDGSPRALPLALAPAPNALFPPGPELNVPLALAPGPHAVLLTSPDASVPTSSKPPSSLVSAKHALPARAISGEMVITLVAASNAAALTVANQRPDFLLLQPLPVAERTGGDTKHAGHTRHGTDLREGTNGVKLGASPVGPHPAFRGDRCAASYVEVPVCPFCPRGAGLPRAGR